MQEKQKYQVANVGIKKLKVSCLLVQRIKELRTNEIQHKTPRYNFKTVLTNSNCNLFLGLELTSYVHVQAADDSKRTSSPA